MRFFSFVTSNFGPGSDILPFVEATSLLYSWSWISLPVNEYSTTWRHAKPTSVRNMPGYIKTAGRLLNVNSVLFDQWLYQKFLEDLVGCWVHILLSTVTFPGFLISWWELGNESMSHNSEHVVSSRVIVGSLLSMNILLRDVTQNPQC